MKLGFVFVYGWYRCYVCLLVVRSVLFVVVDDLGLNNVVDGC